MKTPQTSSFSEFIRSEADKAVYERKVVECTP
jgi:hypothetical protein